MEAKAYTTATTRDSAVNTLRAWLNATNIPVNDRAVAGADILIRCMDGSDLPVAVTIGSKPRSVPGTGMTIRAEELRCARLSETHLSNKARSPRQIAFDAFHAITERAGYGRPVPFDRGEEPDRMFSFEDDGFLVPLRHTEFRRAPNPSPAKFERYKSTLKRGAYLFYRSNENLCERHVTSMEDVQNYALFLLVGFVAHHERANPIKYSNDGDENDRLLTAYLKQRFAELRKSWLSQFRRVMPDEGFLTLLSTDMPHSNALNMHGKYRSLDAAAWQEKQEDEVYPEDTRVFDFRDLASDEALPLTTEGDEELQQARSKKALTKALLTLPHDQLVSTLTYIGGSDEHDEETRKMARRQLLLHSRRCVHCCLPKRA